MRKKRFVMDGKHGNKKCSIVWFNGTMREEKK